MAVTQKVQTWFLREHGYGLREAVKTMRPQSKPREGTHLVGRGYPLWGKAVSIAKIDADNERLAEKLATKTGKALQ